MNEQYPSSHESRATSLADSGFLVDFFYHAANEHPDRVAVHQGEEHITYEELETRSRRIANYLLAQGMGPEVIIALYMERSIDALIAFLGILRAGGVYLPIDVAYPEERVHFILKDAQVSFVMTQASLCEKLQGYTGNLCVIEHLHRLLSDSAPPTLSLTLDNLAYIIYTSGSTGKPKGTLVSHRGLVRLALTQKSAFHVKPGERILQFASLSFDASISEFVVTLTAGATLCLVNRNSLLLGSALGDFMEQQAITIATLSPSVLSTLPNTSLPSLHTLVVAGEACPSELVQRWGAGRFFLNAYGPTENTVCATVGLCIPDQERVSIGHPLDHVEVYLLDADCQPVPHGSIGEIHLGGAGIARGYLHQAALTAERFIPHPFSHQPGSRLYKTGDLAHYLPDNSIEFIGRIDQQVKIRGIRVEPGEIEAVLLQHPQIESAVVIAVSHDYAHQLVAYVVSSQEDQLTAMQIRQFLSQQLPDYMLPAHILFLPALPLTFQGKVDRQALPAITTMQSFEDFAQPGTLENQIIAICQEVLALPSIGVSDDLFELGMHSLSAMQIIEKINMTFNTNFPLVQIFATPTPIELMRLIETLDGRL